MPSVQISDCLPKLAATWLGIKDDYQRLHPANRLIVTCTKRSIDEQFEAFKAGRYQLADGSWAEDDNPSTHILTQLDGVRHKSKHNLDLAAAIDFAIVIAGKITWDPKEYAIVGAMAKDRGLRWGGDFSFRDYPHIEAV